MKKIIFLIGFMGSGKSTIGKLLAEYLGWDFVDIDRLVEEKEGMKIKDIFKVKGEKYFRNLEMQILKSLLSRNKVIVATGGGLGANKKALNLMKRHGFVIWLDISFDDFIKRCGRDVNRPLSSMGKEKLMDLFRERSEVYKKAHIKVNSGKSPYHIVKNIADWLPWKE